MSELSPAQEQAPHPTPTEFASEPAVDLAIGRRILNKTLAISAGVGIALSGSPETTPVEFREDTYHAPQWDMTIPAEHPGDTPTALHFENLRDGGAFAAAPTDYIAPNNFLQELSTAEASLTNKISLTPISVADPANFTKWVQLQSKRPDLRKHAGVVEGQETPQQLINLAADTVVANIDYEQNRDLDPIRATYRKPIDENLMSGTPLQCEGYSAATKAVFEELKKLYPKTLQNTYLTTHSGIMEGHVWNLAVQITSPSSAEVAFVDATESDPTYKGASNLNAVQFLEGINGNETFAEKRLIDDVTFTQLMSEYEASDQATAHDKKEIADNRRYIS